MDELFKQYNYPPANRFYQILKGNGIKATHLQVKEFIEKQVVSQVHKKIEKRKSKYKHFLASFPNEIFQIDLLDYQKYAQQNRGFKWVLICIDVFTRKAYGKPVKNKTANLVKEAFKSIGVLPAVIFHDEGNEFKGEFRKFIDEKNIVDVENESKNHNALGIVDRFSRTIKTAISKYMTANSTTKWHTELSRLIEIYNDTPHRGIALIKPEDVEGDAKNEIDISTLNYHKQTESQKVHKKEHPLKIGDNVRTLINKGTFTKGYEITYSKNVYIIERIEHSKATLNNGKTYPFSQLQKVPEGSIQLKVGKKEQAENLSKIARQLAKEGLK
jgi:hypothetical protein